MPGVGIESQAEALAFFQGFSLIWVRQVKSIVVIGDSMVMIQQMTNLSIAKSSSLAILIDRIERIAGYVEIINFYHIFRHHNIFKWMP